MPDQVTLVPLGQWKWTDDLSYHRTLTCINHQGMVYYTKNPWSRHIHIINVDDTVKAQGKSDCECEFADLRVVAEYSQAPSKKHD